VLSPINAQGLPDIHLVVTELALIIPPHVTLIRAGVDLLALLGWHQSLLTVVGR
jgi:hypothetical protein